MKFAFLLFVLLFARPNFADIISREQGYQLQVKLRGNHYQYVLLDNKGTSRWESQSYDKAGIDFSSMAPLSPPLVAEDITLALNAGTLAVFNDGNKLTIGVSPDKAMTLTGLNEQYLKTNLSAEARKNPSNWVISKYRNQVAQLENQLRNCNATLDSKEAPSRQSR